MLSLPDAVSRMTGMPSVMSTWYGIGSPVRAVMGASLPSTTPEGV